MVTTLVQLAIQAAIAAAVSYVAGTLLAKDKKSVINDDRPQTLAQRGSYLPLLFGTRMMGPLFAWVGDRVVAKKDGGGCSMGGGGGEGAKYYESGWHLLAVGPVFALNRIKQGGKDIWTTRLTRDDTPSGSTFVCDNDEGTFTIWWGECDQPPNEYLSDPTRLGIYSRWPNFCQILWHPKKLHTSPTWPVLEYEAEYRMPVTNLADSLPWIGEGVNPAHAIWQLLTAPYPHGIGLTADAVDEEFIEWAGAVLQCDQHGINYLIENGQTSGQTIQEILEEATTFMPYRDGKLAIYPIRNVECDPPTLDDDLVEDESPQIAQLHGDFAPDRLFITFKRADLEYRDFPVQFSDDGVAHQRLAPQEKRVDLKTVTKLHTAVAVGKRIYQAASVDGNEIPLVAARGARSLIAGQPVMSSEHGQLRVASVKLNLRAPIVELSCLLDQYAVESDWEPDEDGQGGGNNTDGPEVDPIVRVVEVPAAFASATAIVAIRVRAHSQIDGAAVHVSSDGTSYVSVGLQPTPAQGGTLMGSILIGDADPIEEGPTIAPVGPDIGDVLDLTGNSTEWLGGRQCCLINDELFYLRSVTAVPGGYRLDGLKRARQGTALAAHAAGDDVVIFQFRDQIRFTGAAIVAGQDVYVKTQPTANGGSVALSAVTPVIYSIPA